MVLIQGENASQDHEREKQKDEMWEIALEMKWDNII